jgi:hypothetical protein
VPPDQKVELLWQSLPLKSEKAEPRMTLPSSSFQNVALDIPATRHTVVVLTVSFSLCLLPSPAC